MPINMGVARCLAAWAMAPLLVCGACSWAGPVPPDSILRVGGTLTEDGVECPALRGEDGQLYTLTGDLEGMAPGDHVCVQGRLAEISICQQGTTLSVEQISAGACAD